MVKLTKGQVPAPSNENDLGSMAVAPTAAAPINLKVLAKGFAPAIKIRAVKDLKANSRNARTRSPCTYAIRPRLSSDQAIVSFIPS